MEYQNDPDLWYALQASLGEKVVNNNDSNEMPKTQSTGKSINYNNFSGDDFNNVSFESTDAVVGEPIFKKVKQT